MGVFAEDTESGAGIRGNADNAEKAPLNKRVTNFEIGPYPELGQLVDTQDGKGRDEENDGVLFHFTRD